MLREGLLRFNNVILLTWTAHKTCIAGCDFECYKRISLLSLDTNWFLDDIVKCPSNNGDRNIMFFLLSILFLNRDP
jgi:hypothetical protein